MQTNINRMTFMSVMGKNQKSILKNKTKEYDSRSILQHEKNHTHRQWGNVVALIVFAKWYLVAPQLLKPETVVHGSENYNKFQH